MSADTGLVGTGVQLHPTGSGFVKPDWTVGVGEQHPFACYGLLDVQGAPIGQMLGIPSDNTQSQWAARRGQDGYRWTATAFPDLFRMKPLPGGHTAVLGLTPIWYQQAPFQPADPPVGPASKGTLWRITHEPQGAEELVGFLIRTARGDSMRWIIRAAKLSVLAGKEGLPLDELKFERLASTEFPQGPYAQAAESIV